MFFSINISVFLYLIYKPGGGVGVPFFELFLDFFLEVTHLLHQFQHFHFVDVLLRLLQFGHELVDEVIFVYWVFSLFVH